MQDEILLQFYSTDEWHLAFQDIAVKSTAWPRYSCMKGQLLTSGRAHWL